MCPVDATVVLRDFGGENWLSLLAWDLAQLNSESQNIPKPPIPFRSFCVLWQWLDTLLMNLEISLEYLGLSDFLGSASYSNLENQSPSGNFLLGSLHSSLLWLWHSINDLRKEYFVGLGYIHGLLRLSFTAILYQTRLEVLLLSPPLLFLRLIPDELTTLVFWGGLLKNRTYLFGPVLTFFICQSCHKRWSGAESILGAKKYRNFAIFLGA